MDSDILTLPESSLTKEIDILIDEASVTLVAAESGQMVGSGFLIAPNLILTCQHVAAHRGALEARRANMRSTVTNVVDDCPAFDLAILQVEGEIGIALAATATGVIARLLTGRAAVDAKTTGIVGSAPFELTLNGQVSICYRADGTVVHGAIDLSGKGVGPGASGSPLVDRDMRAAVAVVVGGYQRSGVERVWAVPLAPAAACWGTLATILQANERDIARYGAAINARGFEGLFAVLLHHKLKNLVIEERFVPKLDVSRVEVRAWLAAFIASEKTVIGIVGPSNVGKSWALASFALATGAEEVRFLLEARTLGRPTPPLPGLIYEQLRGSLNAASMRFLPDQMLPAPQQMGAILSRSGIRAIVIIDGLNEAPDRQFLIEWLREALAWCRQYGVQLVLSCREESWPDVVELLELRPGFCYVPEHQDSRPDRSDSSMRLCFQLSDFSDEEAVVAAQRYEVDSGETGRHPLMFRLAHLLQGDGALAVGRFRVLRRYIERQLKRVSARLDLGPYEERQLRTSLVALADAMQPGGAGGVSEKLALATIASEAALDALVTDGILSSSAGHVRFRHDPLADVLRTVDPRMTAAFADETSDNRDRDTLQLAATALLRLESEGEEEDYERAIAELLTGLKIREDFWLLSEAIRIVRSLPRSRKKHIEEICVRLSEVTAPMPGIASCIGEAPIDVEIRVQLLLVLATKISGDDDSGWPVRLKDWREQDRRHAFLDTIEGIFADRTPQRYLYRLLQSDRPSVFPLLLNGLNDNRRIEREATVASLCGGVLFVDAAQNLNPLLSALLESPLTECTIGLLDALISEYPDKVAEALLASAATGSTGDGLIRALLEIQRAVPDNETEDAIRKMFDLFNGEPTRIVDAMALAESIRRFDPDEVTAWRFLCDHWHSYLSAGAIPASHFEQALEWIRERGIDFAHFVSKGHHGTGPQQICLVEAVRAGLATTLPAEQFRWLVEWKLDQFNRVPEMQKPWLELAFERAPSGDPGLRSHLACRAFSRWSRYAWEVQLRDLLLSTPFDVEELSAVVHQIMRPAQLADEWLDWIDKARRHDREHVDRLLWEELAGWYDEELAHSCATRLVAYWRSPGTSGVFAGQLLARLDAGQLLENLLE